MAQKKPLPGEPITITQAAKLAPGRPSTNAVWRWCRKGINARNGEKIHLEHIRQGGRIFTSEAALQRFGQDLARADEAYFDSADAGRQELAMPVTRSDSQREASIARAKQTLAAAGI